MPHFAKSITGGGGGDGGVPMVLMMAVLRCTYWYVYMSTENIDLSHYNAFSG